MRRNVVSFPLSLGFFPAAYSYGAIGAVFPPVGLREKSRIPRKCSRSPPFALGCAKSPISRSLSPCPRLSWRLCLPCVVLRHSSGRLWRLCYAVSGILCSGGIPVWVRVFRRLWRRSVRFAPTMQVQRCGQNHHPTSGR